MNTTENGTIRQVSSNELAEYTIDFCGPDIEIVAKMLAGVLGNAPHLIVTAPPVDVLYANKLSAYLNANFKCDTTVYCLEVAESTKDIGKTLQVAEACFEAGLKRNSAIIAVGGGIVMDVACFTSSMYRRGIEFIKVPTTLIGQIDAGIGIKGGVNFNDKKSLLGCFYPPKKVVINTAFLETLEPDAILQGISEIIKIAMVRNKALFTLIEENITALIESNFQAPAPIGKKIIEQSIHDMMDELEPNLSERKSLKRPADFGHTISPLLEVKTGFQLGHGYAVSIDMAVCAALSLGMGRMEKADFLQFIDLLLVSGLPIRHNLLTPEFIQKSFTDAEKHRAGNLNLVMPVGIGKCEIIENRLDIPDKYLSAAIELLEEVCQPKLQQY